jgi:hypothetical protein
MQRLTHKTATKTASLPAALQRLRERKLGLALRRP